MCPLYTAEMNPVYILLNVFLKNIIALSVAHNLLAV